MLNLLMIAIGLSMDAFAVSTTNGMCVSRQYKRQSFFTRALVWSAMFGLFQGLMPMLGYFLGKTFASFISSIDHWIAFILLGLIGINMVREALGSCEECEEGDESLDVRTMLGLAIATSIDALAVGVTFAFLQVQIVPAVCFIGGITFTLSAAGVKIGNIFGTKYKSKAELAGGVILILMGGKILLEHLGILF